jgi:flagellar FliJ protein
MARFRFRLEPLLRARRLAEQARQRAVAEIERERLTLEDRLRRQQQFISEGKQEMRDRMTGELDVDSMRLHAGATMRLMRDAERMVIALAGVHQRLDAARSELIEATRDRRAVELLRERRFEQWRAAIEKADDAAIDELAVHAAARKERER